MSRCRCRRASSAAERYKQGGSAALLRCKCRRCSLRVGPVGVIGAAETAATYIFLTSRRTFSEAEGYLLSSARTSENASLLRAWANRGKEERRDEAFGS